MIKHLLAVVSIVELSIVAILLTALVVHAYWVVARTQTTRNRYLRIRSEVMEMVGEGDSGSPISFEGASGLNERVLAEIAGNVAGSAKDAVTEAASQMGLLEKSSRRCRSRRWWSRLKGVREFTLFGGGQEVVPCCLDDVHPLVRAAAIVWAAQHPDDGLVRRVVAKLNDPDLRCQYYAQDALSHIGARIAEPLVEYLGKLSNEGGVRRASASSFEAVLNVAIGVADARFLPSALQAMVNPAPSVRARAASLLAAITGPDAESALEQLCRDAHESVRAAAVRGLGDFQTLELAPKMARMLGDPSWEVRREAGLGLARLGPAGRLYLRRALHNPDVFATEMARQILDLPAGMNG